MAVIKSGATSDNLTVGVTSKAAFVELRDAAGLALQNLKTYAASASFTPPATPQDLVVIFGSATKTVRVHSVKIGTANTAAGSQIFTLSKRSAVGTGGTETAATIVPFDSGDAAATATVKHIITTANTPGAAVGTLRTIKVGTPAVTPATWAGINTTDNDVEMLPTINGQTKAVVLRGIAEGLAINFAGAALVAGQIHTYNVVFSEE